MRAPRLAAASTAAFLFAVAGCGSGDGIAPRPVETLIYVQGPTGATFTFNEIPNNRRCPPFGNSKGTGIEAPNASHQFCDGGEDSCVDAESRVFQTPHLFVLENIQQPVQAVISNPASSTAPIQVNIYLGTLQRVGGEEGVIQPGQCRTIITDTQAALAPNPRGAETQVEVCSPRNESGDPDLRIPCLESTNDRSIAFGASIGDVRASNLTNCILSPILDTCRSPATFFLEQPRESVNAVMNVNPLQNPGGNEPTAEVLVELYINDRLEAKKGGTQAVVSVDL
jgi:hypothetical protein